MENQTNQSEQANQVPAASSQTGQVDAGSNAQDISTNDTFGKPIEDNAFGISGISQTPKSSDPEPDPEDAGGLPAANQQKPAKEVADPAKPAAQVNPDQKDALLEQLKAADPDFADFCDKKGIKDIKSAVRLYRDQEAEFTRRSAQLNEHRKELEKYYTFDEKGNRTGLTELGKKIHDQINGQAQARNDGQGQGQPQIDHKAMTEAFWGKFESDPIGTIVNIVNALAPLSIKDQHEKINGELTSLKDGLKPYFAEQEKKKATVIVDEVINGLVSGGDLKAKDFFTQYDAEIQAELNKVPPEFFKVNPKQAIENAYRLVRAAKVEEFQKNILKKQDEARMAAAAAGNSGTGSQAPVQPEVDPEIGGLQQAFSTRPQSAFFG